MSKTTKQFVLLTGSDMGNREQYLAEAKELITYQIGKPIKASSIMETAPWGFESATKFLNQALLIETRLEPLQLLLQIQSIETEMGRVRQSEQWSSRIIDIDILCGENIIYHSDELSIPHKLLHKRDFALKPLCQVTPNWRHPLLKTSYSTLLSNVVSGIMESKGLSS